MTDIQSNEVPFAVLEDEVIPPHVGLEVEIYKHNDPNVRLDVIPNRWDVSALDEIRKPGGGTFSLWRNDPKLLENPAILDWRNIVRVKLNHETVGAFLIQNKEADIVSREEMSGEVWQVTGEGLRSWFRDAVVLPYGGLKAKSAPQRVFSFASEQGAWYKPEDWHAPIKIQQHNLDPNPGPWGTAPSQWPDAPDAWWVWGVNNNASIPAPAGYNFFRYEFDIPESVGTKNYSLFAAGDNQMIAYVDAQELITADENDSWTRTWRGDVELDPGHHVLAFRVLNTGTSPAALIAAFFRAGDAAAETAAELLTVTGDPGWLVNPYPDPAPGWTAGEIMLTLLAEADARGVQFPAFLTPTFDAEVDSAGQAWSRALDWNFGIGSEYYEVIERLEEAVCDLWIDPDLLTLNMYVQRGVDRTTQTRALTPIKFEVGRNILRAHEEGTSDIKNTLALSTTDGFFLQSDAMTDSISKYGRIEGLLSTGLSPDVSGDVANSVFSQKAIPTMAQTYEVIDSEDARPFVDFGTGDFILAPNAEDEPTPTRILSLSVAEDPKTGRPIYAMEFGTISDDIATRHERWLKTLSNASLGGTVVNSGGGGASGSSANPGQATQDGPQGAQGPAGPAGMTYRGVWTNSIEYTALDSVSHEGSTWISNVSDNLNSEPAEGNTDWTLLAKGGSQGESAYEVAVAEGFVGDEAAWLASLVGPQGPAGPGVTYRGAWSPTTEYVAGDLVSYLDSFWIADGYNLNKVPGTDPVWDSYDTGGVPITLTPNILYGTDGSGDQTTYGIAQSSSAGAVAQRTTQSTLKALTTADGVTGDSDEVLVNKGFLARFRGDSVANVTLTNAGSTATTATQDVLFFTGSTVASYTVTLPTGLTAFKRITLAFLAEVTALTINPGAGNTVNVAPLTAPVNTVLVYEYNAAQTKWILVSQYPVGSGSGGGISYEAAWDSTISYQTGDVVVANDGTGAATWLAISNVLPASTPQHVGTTQASSDDGAAFFSATPHASTQAGDLLVLTVSANSPPVTAVTGYAAALTAAGSDSGIGAPVQMQVFYRTATGTSADVAVATSKPRTSVHLTTLRALAWSGTPTSNATATSPATTGATAVLEFWAAYQANASSPDMAAPSGVAYTSLNKYVTASYTMQNRIAYTLGDTAGRLSTNARGSVSVKLNAAPGVSFAPGTSWVKLGVTSAVTSSTIKGSWNSATSYAVNDVVLRNGDTYVANTANSATDPATDGVATSLTGTSTATSGLTQVNSAVTRAPFTVGASGNIATVTVTSRGAVFASGTIIGLVPSSWNGTGTVPWLGKYTLSTAQASVGALTATLDALVPVVVGSSYQVVVTSPQVTVGDTGKSVSGIVSSVATPFYGSSSSAVTTALTGYAMLFSVDGASVPAAPKWTLLADGVPSSTTADNGKVLSVTAGVPAWAAAAGGSEFKGSWNSAATYVSGDQVVYGSADYKALRSTTNENPSAVASAVYVGPWGASDGPFAAQAAMQISSPTPGTYPSVRLSYGGTGRVGFSATKPTAVGAVAWLAYADVSGSSVDTTVALNTPLVIAAGTASIWAVWEGASGNNISGSTVSVTSGGTTTMAWYGATYTSQNTTYRLLIQAVAPPSPAWSKVYDIPFLSTSVKGEWSATSTYVKDDVVLRNGATYVCVTSSTNVDPSVPIVTSSKGGVDTPAAGQSLSTMVRLPFTLNAAVTITELAVKSVTTPFPAGVKWGIVPSTWNGTGTPPYITVATLGTAQSAAGALTVPLPAAVTLAAGDYQFVSTALTNKYYNSTPVLTGAVSALGALYYGASETALTSNLGTGVMVAFALMGPPTVWWNLLAPAAGFRGAWSPSLAYNAGDSVSYNGVIYATSTALAAAATPVAITDDFASSLNARYVSTDSGSMSYTTSSGRLSCTNVGTVVTGAATGALLMDTTANAHSIEITNYRTATSGYSSLWVAYTNPTNWLNLRFDSGGGVSVYQNLAGTVTTLTTFSVTAWTNVAGGMKIKADVSAAKVLTVTFNGTLVYTTTLTSFLGTKAGVGDSFTAISTWDDLTVTGSPDGTFNAALWYASFKDTYKGQWAAATAYAIGDTVDRSGLRYAATLASTGTDPVSPPTYVTVGAQTNGANNGSGGGAGSALVVQFVPTTNMAISAMRYQFLVSGGGTFKVGIASAVGVNPAAITWLGAATGQSGAVGTYVAPLPAVLNLVAGTTYYAVLYSETGTNTFGAAHSGGGAGTYTGITSPGAFNATSGANWSSLAAGPAFRFDLLNMTSPWLSTGLPVAVGVPSGGTDDQVLTKVSGVPAWANAGEFKGDWASGSTYARGDQAYYQGKYYKAQRASVGEVPTVAASDVHTGTWVPSPGAFATEAATQWNSPLAGTYQKVRLAYGGAGRIGFTAAKPTSSSSVTWLAYADVTGSSADNTVTLNTPLVIAPGTASIWAVWVGTGGNILASSAGGYTDTGVTASGSIYYGTSFASGPLSYRLATELISLATPAWTQVWTVPAAPGYRGAWSAASPYVKNETVQADDGSGLATWVALSDLTPAANVLYVGSKTVGFSGATGVTPPTGSQAGDTVLLSCLSGSTPTTPTGYTLLTSGNNFWIYSKVLASASETVNLGAGTSLSWTMRTYRSAGTITATTGTLATIPAQTGVTGAAVGMWGSYSAYTMTAPATCSNIVTVTGDYRTHVTADIPVVGGTTAAVTALNPAGNANDTYAVVKIAPAAGVPFVPGSSWAKVGAVSTSLAIRAKGEWASTTAYKTGDLVTRGTNLYEASAASTNTDPASGSTTTGPTNAISAAGDAGEQYVSVQYLGIPAGTYTKIKISGTGGKTARVGISTTQPTTSTPTFIAYADVTLTGYGSWVTGTLNTPVVLASASDLYFVFIGQDSTTHPGWFNAPVPITGAASKGFVTYGSTFSGVQGTAASMAVQFLGTLAASVWSSVPIDGNPLWVPQIGGSYTRPATTGPCLFHGSADASSVMLDGDSWILTSPLTGEDNASVVWQTSGNGSASWTPDSSVQVGDLAVFLYTSGDQAAFSPGAGWTLLEDQVYVGYYGVKMTAWTKTVTSLAADSIVTNETTHDSWVVSYVRGVSGLTARGQSTTNLASTYPLSASTAQNSLALIVAASSGPNPSGNTVPSPWTSVITKFQSFFLATMAFSKTHSATTGTLPTNSSVLVVTYDFVQPYALQAGVYTKRAGSIVSLALPPTTGNGKVLTTVAGVPTWVAPETRAAAAPTTGTGAVGDRVYNSAPAAGGWIGWVCVTAGNPGTWKGFGAIEA